LQQPIWIETALLRDKTLNDVPLRIFRAVQDYDMLPQKANPQNRSDPGGIYYEFQLTNSFLFTDVGAAADVTKYIVLTYLEAEQDFNNPLDAPEYPQEWYLPLAWGLAAQGHSMFHVTWTDSMEKRYMEALRIAQNKEAEIRTEYFQCGAED
jgi:hypothetical protein